MKYYIREVASRCWMKTGQHVVNYTDDKIIVYVECVDSERARYDGIVVETIDQQCQLLDRMAKQCDELLPPYTHTDIADFEQEYNCMIPPLLRYQLLKISRQLMSDAGTEQYIDLKEAMMFSMRAITEKELEDEVIRDMMYDDVLNLDNGTLLLRLYKTKFCTFDLIVKGAGYGRLIQKEHGSICGFMDDLWPDILKNERTFDTIFGLVYDQY